ncbi:MAG TPA: hypothetical protein VF881_15280 [Polyangiaceae bacterium]
MRGIPFTTLRFESLAADFGRPALATLTLLCLAPLACTRSGTASRTPASAAQSTVTLELEHGPAPALPNPMLVTDSVHGGTFESCYQSFRPTGNAERDLTTMTSLCGPPNSMKPVTPVIQGNQSQKDAIARFTFRGEMGRCYRVFSASDRGIADMDMAMLDPDKNVVGHDTNQDAFPMLNPDGPFCLTRPGIYTVLVSVEKGAGRYALQVWGF